MSEIVFDLPLEDEGDDMPTNQVAKVEPAPNAVVAITPMQMLQIAVEKGADLDQLQKLMDLQERWEKNNARKAFVADLAAFKADPPRITKNRHVAFQTSKGRTEYDHATLDQVSEVIGKALAQHGLSHTWEVKQYDNAAIEVTCVLTHALGHSERVMMRAMPDDSGGKNLIQQTGSTVTYLERYTLLAATGLAAADQDDDAASGGNGESISAEEKEKLIALLKDTGSDTVKFLAYLGVPNLDALPAKRFGEAVAALEKKRKSAKKEA